MEEMETAASAADASEIVRLNHVSTRQSASKRGTNDAQHLSKKRSRSTFVTPTMPAIVTAGVQRVTDGVEPLSLRLEPADKAAEPAANIVAEAAISPAVVQENAVKNATGFDQLLRLRNILMKEAVVLSKVFKARRSSLPNAENDEDDDGADVTDTIDVRLEKLLLLKKMQTDNSFIEESEGSNAAFRCPLCSEEESFDEEEALNQHIEELHMPDNYFCMLCISGHGSLPQIYDHVAHSRAKPPGFDRNALDYRRFCLEDGQKPHESDDAETASAKQIVLESRPVACAYCGVLLTVGQLRRHVLTLAHKINVQEMTILFRAALRILKLHTFPFWVALAPRYLVTYDKIFHQYFAQKKPIMLTYYANGTKKPHACPEIMGKCAHVLCGGKPIVDGLLTNNTTGRYCLLGGRHMYCCDANHHTLCEPALWRLDGWSCALTFKDYPKLMKCENHDQWAVPYAYQFMYDLILQRRTVQSFDDAGLLEVRRFLRTLNDDPLYRNVVVLFSSLNVEFVRALYDENSLTDPKSMKGQELRPDCSHHVNQVDGFDIELPKYV